ncbi:hypothetical protein OAO55_01180 [Bacteroidales bacterium]|nr:hypothetical protein [Bacteroidales bacterium]
MKQYISLFSLLMLSCFVYGQYFVDETEKERIASSSITYKTIWEHRVKEGKMSPKGFKASETSFDAQGNELEKISYQYSGALSSKLTSKYDGQGNLIDYQRFDGRKNKITQKKSIKHSPDNLKIMEQGTSGSSAFRNIYKYDHNNNLVEIEYFSDNILTQKRVIAYFSDRREIQLFKGENTPDGKIVKTIDSKGNILEEKKISAAGIEVRKFVYTYNSAGKKLSETKYYSGNFREKLEYKYNVNNMLIEIYTTDSDKKRVKSNILTYDAKNQLIKEQWYNAGKDAYSHKKHTYNSRGDLIQTRSFNVSYSSEYVYRYQYE